MIHKKPDFRDWSLLIILTIIWGFSYYFIKHSLTDFNPSQISGLRMLFSAIALTPFLYASYKIIPLNKWPLIMFVGFLGSFLPAFMYPWAQQKISSSLAGIINAFTPICTYAIGILIFQVKSEKMKVMGSLIAFAGAIVLIAFKPGAEFRAEALYLLVAFMVPFLYGLNGNMIKSKLSDFSGLQMTATMYISLLIFSIPLCFYTGAFQQIPISLAKGNAFYHLLALSVLGSALAMALFNILIKRVHVLFAASVTYLMPLVSIVVGWLDGEKIGWNDILGFSFILVGVLIMNGVVKRKESENSN